MFLWIIIIVSIVFAWIGYKKGLFVMFATLFNLMFATFIAVLSTPKLLSMSTGYESSGYYAAAGVVLLFILVFGLLQLTAWFYFLRDAEGLFPKLVDKAGAVILGALSGYVICCLLFLTICVMPCSVGNPDDPLAGRSQMQALSVPGVERVCNFLGWYSLHCFEGNSEKAVAHLLALAERPDGREADRTRQHEPNPLETTPAETLPQRIPSHLQD